MAENPQYSHEDWDLSQHDVAQEACDLLGAPTMPWLFFVDDWPADLRDDLEVDSNNWPGVTPQQASLVIDYFIEHHGPDAPDESE